jgi:EmrB/QacA subfamily drug resistance transporter
MSRLDAPARAPQRPASPWRVFWITSLPIVALSLDATVLYVAFPAIRRTFADVSAAELSWVLNAYTVVFGALLVPGGRLADRIGRRTVFIAGVALFTAGSAICGLAPSPSTLIGARALQAIGAALALPSSLALILAAFPRERRTVAVSLWGAVGALSAAIGPSLGSLIVQSLSWRWVFFLNLPVGVAATILIRRVAQESKDPSAGPIPRVVEVAALVVGVAALAYAIVQGNDWGWGDARIVGAFTIAAIALAGFVVSALHARAPVVDFALFRNATYRYANLGMLVFAIGFSAMFFGFILFQTHVWGYSTLEAGLGITPGPLMVIPCAIVGGRIAARRGHRRVLVLGSILYALGGALLAFAMPVHPAYVTRFLPAGLITGIGVGLVLPSLSAAAVHGLPDGRFAVGSAINMAIRQIGSVLGVALVIALLARSPGPEGFTNIFQLLIGSGLIMAVLALGIDTAPGPRRGS